MSFFAPAPIPPTKLGRVRQLAPRAGIHVSPLALGAMSIGDKMGSLWHGCHGQGIIVQTVGRVLFDAGGNHIDTANAYQDGSSEEFIGEWVEARGYRDQVVIATKVHYWDLHTSVEEMMDSLHHLVAAGTVLFILGISDSPAWFVVKANEYAKANGKTPFVVFQAPYSVTERDIEREIMPMCRHEGMALTLWNVLASGHIRTDAEEELRRSTGEKGRTILTSGSAPRTRKKCAPRLEVVAKEVGAKYITAVAIANTLHKAPFVYPIIGGRKVEHPAANIEALDITLTKEQMAYIDGILPFGQGLPSQTPGRIRGPKSFLKTMNATYDRQPLLPPVAPASD
ncbi:Aryl-alcohol dehydrogenase [Mycena venus]|uniref:Aryl-alcohol dehydrogenase n=1 Tax=Mycena venus TaxID=2733690 RepID=A0A8H6TWL0_9AGAR|nr:Aryl-alcohol dehydrogenase [Mycena venus]